MGLDFLMKTAHGTPEWTEHLVEYGRELTAQVAEAEARGDDDAVDSLLRIKDYVNCLRREVTYVGR